MFKELSEKRDILKNISNYMPVNYGCLQSVIIKLTIIICITYNVYLSTQLSKEKQQPQ